MKKITILFKKDPSDLSRVINEIEPENEWALTESVPTRKYDGNACAVINGELYRRQNVRIRQGLTLPKGSIPCQDPDPITGRQPYWIPVIQHPPYLERYGWGSGLNKYLLHAFYNFKGYIESGTYELIGEKILTKEGCSNPEKVKGHILVRHGADVLDLTDYSFEGIRAYLADKDIEGIVFHHKTDDRMCKIRKKDFGLKRVV
jgi:hypothetical protein